MKKKPTKWWGTFHFEERQQLYWELGPLLLGIKRLSHEWHVANDTQKNDLENSSLKIASETSPTFTKETSRHNRYFFHKTEPSLHLIPTLADRSQVSRAETPFYLPVDEHVTIYVSSPVWVRIEVGDKRLMLDEIPSLRLSDTWYGPNTREGELCYSSPTFCRTSLAELPFRPHRVISPIIIQNHSKQPLLIEQLSLPLPFLSIYADMNGNLWTEEILVKNEPHHKNTIRQGKGAPSIVPSAALVNHARLHLKAHNFMTLFYSLLTD